MSDIGHRAWLGPVSSMVDLEARLDERPGIPYYGNPGTLRVDVVARADYRRIAGQGPYLRARSSGGSYALTAEVGPDGETFDTWRFEAMTPGTPTSVAAADVSAAAKPGASPQGPAAQTQPPSNRGLIAAVVAALVVVAALWR